MASRESLSSGVSLHDELSEVDEVEFGNDQSFGNPGFTLEGSESDDIPVRKNRASSSVSDNIVMHRKMKSMILSDLQRQNLSLLQHMIQRAMREQVTLKLLDKKSLARSM